MASKETLSTQEPQVRRQERREPAPGPGGDLSSPQGLRFSDHQPEPPQEKTSRSALSSHASLQALDAPLFRQSALRWSKQMF